MTFAELLREYIGKRTLDEMTALCAEKGLQLDPTYISKLRTGNRPAPDDENIVRVLAQVCGKDPEPLLLLAKVERRPQSAISDLLLQASQVAFSFNAAYARSLNIIADVAEKARAGESPEAICAFIEGFEAEIQSLAEDGMRKQEAFDRVVMLIAPELTFDKSSIVNALKDSIGFNLPTGSEEDLVTQLADVAEIPVYLLEELLSFAKGAHRLHRTRRPDLVPKQQFFDFYTSNAGPIAIKPSHQELKKAVLTEEQIREKVATFVDAWNKQDINRLDALLAEDHTAVFEDGSMLTAREHRKGLTRLFVYFSGTTMEMKVLGVKECVAYVYGFLRPADWVVRPESVTPLEVALTFDGDKIKSVRYKQFSLWGQKLSPSRLDLPASESENRGG